MISARKFLLKMTAACSLSIAFAGLGAMSTDAAAQTAPAINVTNAVKSLQITSGPYANGYLIAPNGMLNWYFTNLGLLPIVQYLSPADLNTYVLSYLNLYIKNLTVNSTISDVTFTPGTNNFVLVPSDSDDSYAATFLSLAVRYVNASQNWTWWAANEAALKNMAYRNLAVMQKPGDGLISTFQPPRNQTNALGYLMDNSEDYRGLRDFASVLRNRGETADANYYDLVATGIADGISIHLYDTSHAGFMTSDGDAQATTIFYAGTTCQVFPQAFGISELSAYYSHSWTYLNQYSQNWQNGQYNSFPWAILGYVAAMRGLTVQAQAQLQMINTLFVNNRAMVTLNELGFYQRTQSLLAGRPAT
jgi:hypothetical protein